MSRYTRRARRVPTRLAVPREDDGDGLCAPPEHRGAWSEKCAADPTPHDAGSLPVLCSIWELRGEEPPPGEDRGTCSRCQVYVSVPRHLVERLRSMAIDWTLLCQACISTRDREAMAAQGRS